MTESCTLTTSVYQDSPSGRSRLQHIDPFAVVQTASQSAAPADRLAALKARLEAGRSKIATRQEEGNRFEACSMGLSTV